MLKKCIIKSPNALFVAITSVFGLLVTVNSYAEDIPVIKTITNHLSASPETSGPAGALAVGSGQCPGGRHR